MKSNKETVKIDGFSLEGLIRNSLTTTVVLFAPITVSQIAGHDGWMSSIIITVSAACLLYILYYLSNEFPGQTLIEYLPLILGKAVGKIVGQGYIVFIIYLTGSVIREALALFYSTGVFTFTPEIVVVLLLVVGSSYGVAAGIEVIARTMGFYFVLIGIIYLTFIGIAVPHIKWDAFLPVGEAGFMTILQSTMIGHSYRGELFLLAMLFPYCRSNREGYIAGNIANLMVAFTLFITIIACVGILGEETTARSLFAPFLLADFIQPVGIKVFLLTVWVVGFWGKITLLQFCLTDGIAKFFGLQEPKAMITPIAIILVVFALTFYKNATDVFESISLTFPGAGLFFEYLIPTFLFMVVILKGRLVTKGKGQR